MKCWFCDDAKMESMEGKPHWYLCQKCGATACEKPTKHQEEAMAYGTKGMGGVRRWKPKRGLVR
jgi:hypothetical protein